MELYGRVRYAVRIEGLSERAAARRFGIDPRTVNKMMKFSVPPGYVRKKPPAKPKLDAFAAGRTKRAAWACRPALPLRRSAVRATDLH